MDVKFDATVAEQLIKQMDSYCSGIAKEVENLLDVLELSDEWNDNQKMSFHNNIVEISKDLCKALELESEYMQIFEKKVDELRG